MSNYTKGTDALQMLQSGGNNESHKFSKFSSGTSYNVKVLGEADLVQFYAYGIYKKTFSFVAKNPSTKDDYGFPIDNLTPWDKAFLHLREPEEEYNSKANQEAYKYRAKERYMMGFYDVTEGELIVVDMSKNQARNVISSINSNKDKLDSVLFDLSKTGKGQDTVVSLSVKENIDNLKKMKEAGIDADTDVTDKEIENFYAAPKEFDEGRFNGCIYEADEDEMIINLDKADFDVTLLGLEVPEIEEEAPDKESDSGDEEAKDGDDYDF